MRKSILEVLEAQIFDFDMKKLCDVRILLVIMTLFLIEEVARLGSSSILIDRGDVDSLEKALVFNGSDADLNYRLGRINHIFTIEDENRIQNLYVRSIDLNPLLSLSWLGLTELFMENGEKQKALVTLGRAVSLAPFYIARLWEAAIMALRLGFESLALENLKVIAKADPSKRERVFDLSWYSTNDPDLILNRVVTSDSLPDYLRYLIVRGKLEESYPVWNRIKKEGLNSPDIALYYIDFLASRNRITMASSIWTEMFGERKEDSLVWNGGFEDELIGGWGFDWKIRPVDGVRIDFDLVKRFEGNYSLRLSFDGKSNLDFYHVSQTVPVEPDTSYLLTSYISTNKITTRNGISWEVYCYPGLNGRIFTAPVTGTTDWTRVELPFRTTSDCRAVVVRLRRYQSDKIDRYISGTAWIDDVKLFEVGLDADARSR